MIKLNKHNRPRRQVFVFDAEGNYVTDYESITEAAREEKTSPSMVHKYCRTEKLFPKKNIYYSFDKKFYLKES
jgi:hypothetical protein